MNLFSFQKGILDNSFGLNRAQEAAFDFRDNLFVSNFHGLVELIILIASLFPPHGIQLGNTTPQSRGYPIDFPALNFTNTIIISINKDNKIIINLFPNMSNELFIENGLES